MNHYLFYNTTKQGAYKTPSIVLLGLTFWNDADRSCFHLKWEVRVEQSVVDRGLKHVLADRVEEAECDIRDDTASPTTKEQCWNRSAKRSLAFTDIKIENKPREYMSPPDFSGKTIFITIFHVTSFLWIYFLDLTELYIFPWIIYP